MISTIDAAVRSEIDKFKTTACYKQLNDLTEKHTQANYGEEKNVQYKDKAEEILVAEGYMYHRDLEWKQVGAAPFNRGGEGLVWSRAHSRVAKVKACGFSKNVFDVNAYILEDCPLTCEFAKYTVKVCSSDRRYATYKAEDVFGAALGATHASHGFACVNDAVECEIESISTNGFMDKHKVC